MCWPKTIGLVAIAGALQFGATTDAVAGAPKWLQSLSVQREDSDSRLEGTWYVTGSYDDLANPEPVDFRVYLMSDGTFVDSDNYRGRWVVSNASFAMYYADEAELGYVGLVEGRTITGRFRGEHTSGLFQMTR
jgi:hypothetical protein